jgi:hypothetical protein
MLDIVHAVFPNVLLLNHCKRGSAKARKLIEDVTCDLFPQGELTPDRSHEDEDELVKAVVAKLTHCTNLAAFDGQVFTYLCDSAVHVNKIVHATCLKVCQKLKLLTTTTQDEIDAAIAARKYIQAIDRLYHLGQKLKCTSRYMSGKWRVVTGNENTVVDIDPKRNWLHDPSEPIVDAPAAPAPRKRSSKKAAAPTVMRPQRDGTHPSSGRAPLGTDGADTSTPIEWSTALYHFDYCYSINVHRAQGASLMGDLLLLDGFSKHETLAWMLVACTRGAGGGTLTVYRGLEVKHEKGAATKYFADLMEGNRAADEKAGRKLTYTLWFNARDAVEMFRACTTRCPDCGAMMSLRKGTMVDPNNHAASINRINNDLPHQDDNCYICCASCNKAGGAAARKGAGGDDKGGGSDGGRDDNTAARLLRLPRVIPRGVSVCCCCVRVGGLGGGAVDEIEAHCVHARQCKLRESNSEEYQPSDTGVYNPILSRPAASCADTAPPAPPAASRPPRAAHPPRRGPAEAQRQGHSGRHGRHCGGRARSRTG